MAQVFPASVYDRILYAGFTGEVWMDPDLRLDQLSGTQAVAYRDPNRAVKVVLVLGAGNVSSIGSMDILCKVFVEKHLVVYKSHPVAACLDLLMARGLRALISQGLLHLVSGDVAEGHYLCHHSAVDEIHIPGSDKTVEAIVFGQGEEAERRKAERRPRLTKPISSELGNVSPVIVVPGPWSSRDVDFHAENLVSMVVNNAGFNCNATRMVIMHARWPQREALLERVCHYLQQTALRQAYYPGARQRFAAFAAAHPDPASFHGC